MRVHITFPITLIYLFHQVGFFKLSSGNQVLKLTSLELASWDILVFLSDVLLEWFSKCLESCCCFGKIVIALLLLRNCTVILLNCQIKAKVIVFYCFILIVFSFDLSSQLLFFSGQSPHIVSFLSQFLFRCGSFLCKTVTGFSPIFEFLLQITFPL